MTRPRLKDVSPEKQAAWRESWREAKRKQTLKRGAGKQLQEIIRNEVIEAEMMAVAKLLHQTIDRRPERFLGVLQECLPRLRAARQQLYPLSVATRLIDQFIGIIELMPRRGIR